MQFRIQLQFLMLFSILGGSSGHVFAATGVFTFLQTEPDQLFAQAVQDYKQNRFTDAQAKFERVQGAHSQDSQQYIEKIKAYTEAMTVARGVVKRPPDELDASSIEYAIQRYEEAIKIKPDGPWHPAEQLNEAKELKVQVEQQHAANVKAMAGKFCEKGLAEVQEHHYKEAAGYMCRLANDDPAYSCGVDEASHLCDVYTQRAKMGDSPPSQPQEVGRSGALDKARAAYEKNDFERARSLFEKVPADLKPEADEYLDKISRFNDAMTQAEQLRKAARYEQARAAYVNAANIKADGPGNPQAGALEMELGEGLDQFYSGDYVSATQHLEICVQESMENWALAQFYLGASKLARFFLAGSEDSNLRQDALNDLKTAKQAGFKPDAEDVSPRILEAYNDLAF
jgi:tetratricopeptide (TPR) repeat protein